MPVKFAELGAKISRLRVLVIGDAMLDSYFSGASQRLCQEAPVPIVDVANRLDMPGGAGNCAANVAALGAKVTLLAVAGADCEGELLRERLQACGVPTDDVLLDPERQTLFKARVLCDHHLVVRFDQGTKTPLREPMERQVLARLTALFDAVDLVIVSDYSYGVLTPAVIERLAQLQRKTPKTLLVDAKQLPLYRHVGMTACKPNYHETLKLLGLVRCEGKRRSEALLPEGERVLAHTGAQLVAVTLDREGALFFERGRAPLRTYAQGAPQTQAAGAGDTFLCALGLALAAGADTAVASECASAAAAVAVAKPHTALCSWQELLPRLAGEHGPSAELSRLLPLLASYRRDQKQIVLTNGCFDLLHRGHIAYLEQAKRLGDVLIVGVNTDASIRRLKGPTRPINSLADRMEVLQGLSSVDHTIAFDEDTPHALIRAIRPDVFVKGGDYTRQSLPEAELVESLGGTVRLLPFVADRSTSSIISRICRVHAEDATPVA
jgi:D-beta-D-heptose 7-phosphate kinase/D-beta-D-heptose 1-phosphate adenosyltransferase